jgi:hypothetical protein
MDSMNGGAVNKLGTVDGSRTSVGTVALEWSGR